MIATGNNFPGRSRPLCAYPKTASYDGSVAICVPPMVMVALEMNEMSPPLSVASIRAALSVMLEILLTSAESGPASCDELKLPVKLGGPPPAWNC